MSKTGLKTFVFSFGLTLSAILGIDKAFFYTPETSKEALKIPRKNITLFFNHTHPIAVSSQTEPVDEVVLKTPEFKSEELKIAQSIPDFPDTFVVREDLLTPEKDEIPIQVSALENTVSSESPEMQFSDKQDMPDVPLVYSGTEKNIQSVGNAQKELPEEKNSQQEKSIAINADIPTSAKPIDEAQLMKQPVIIQGTRQIIKIDNLKEHREKTEKLKKDNASELDVLLAKKTEEIPLQDDKNVLKGKDKPQLPQNNQIASLGGEIPLAEAEKQAKSEAKAKENWQTMEERHQGENPWVVARGSRFVKNKQLLKEEFSSENAQKKADALLPQKKEEKSVKVAVQDNILIPIPQEILDEDNLVPTLGDDEVKDPPVKKVKKKAKSLFDSITSVFSKENKQKAIKNIKEKSDKNKKAGKQDDDFQILPTEIRLSFQPNKAEISGQTLRWVQAFAKKAADDDNVGLEIRIDGAKSFELQQRRLNLLYNILKLNGVPYQKINTLFVDREPNSFVMRTVKILKEKEIKEDNSWKKYYQKW